jgi:GxxExxY protein
MREFIDREFPHQELTEAIIGCAIKVHRSLGPGLLESAYEVCLADEFDRSGIPYQRQIALPVIYEGRRLDCGYRLDFIVKEHVILELKCVDKIVPIHEAQLMTYLRLSGKEVGLLMNFNVSALREGIKRKALSSIHPSSALSASLR